MKSHKNVHQIYKEVVSEEQLSLENAHGVSPVCLLAVFSCRFAILTLEIKQVLLMLAYRIHTFMGGYMKHFGERVGGAETILLNQ